MSEEIGRTVSMRPRRKATASSPAEPTTVVIYSGSNQTKFALKTADDERDFIIGKYVATYRSYVPGEDTSQFKPHQLVLNPKGEIVKVPQTVTGLRPGDTVLTFKGGHGDYLAYAMANPRFEVAVLRITPNAVIKQLGESPTKREGEYAVCEALYSLYCENPDLFYETGQPGREEILLRQTLISWQEAQDTRIARENQVLANAEGTVFLTDDLYAAGKLEEEKKRIRAEDPGVTQFLLNEQKLQRELTRLVARHKVWEHILKDVKGIGPLIAARLIASIGDIKRFPREESFVAYCGVHLLLDGSFPRRTRGVVANWNSDCRQALFLFQDQCNRNPDSEWGKKVIEYKKKLNEDLHPADSAGKNHRRAHWRVSTLFARWLYQQWVALEGSALHKTEPTRKGEDPADLILTFSEQLEGTVTPKTVELGVEILDLLLYDRGYRGTSTGARVAEARKAFMPEHRDAHNGAVKALKVRNRIAHPSTYPVPPEKIEWAAGALNEAIMVAAQVL